ncbi:hypothetical protein [Insolitispirillum peregrinum]|uniref:Uncharacterized protein n=1 Tax=Insolitispirillum peregrinum TaxID=80876 RepID=A0A1N7IU14_9PROT|nr:hypothetical protein [Insolitispirillum peregrinum]SIS40599.1 hypothetical protein SAMN05421779_101616 [Insolitispirillum peregrinum]
MSTSQEHGSAPIMYRVCWASVVGGAYGQGRPMPRDVAEFIAYDESLAHPLRTYWLEQCPDGLENGMHRARKH